MSPATRKLALTAHVVLSLAWLGAVAAYFALAVAGIASSDVADVRAADLAMATIGWWVIVPCSMAALVTGLIESLGTEWGLFRHHWVVAKLLLTVAAAVSQLVTLTNAAAFGAATNFGIEFDAVRAQLAGHAGVGLLVLIGLAAVSIYRPWGKVRLEAPAALMAMPAWRLYGVVGLLVVLAMLHLATGGSTLRH